MESVLILKLKNEKDKKEKEKKDWIAKGEIDQYVREGKRKNGRIKH